MQIPFSERLWTQYRAASFIVLRKGLLFWINRLQHCWHFIENFKESLVVLFCLQCGRRGGGRGGVDSKAVEQRRARQRRQQQRQRQQREREQAEQQRTAQRRLEEDSEEESPRRAGEGQQRSGEEGEVVASTRTSRRSNREVGRGRYARDYEVSRMITSI